MLHISQPFSCPGPTRMSLHYLERDEVNGLKLLRRQQQAKWRKRAYVFFNERPPALRPAASPSSLVRSGSEWSQIDLDAAMLHVRGVKSGKPATHRPRRRTARLTPGTESDLRLRLAPSWHHALQGLLALAIHGTSQKLPDFRQQVSRNV
jgi:hypothetical protein